jgi:hypothetical protein
VGSWYHQLRVQDDDDGDLTNGTPHAAAIFAAFDRHDIACGTADDPENQNASSCTPLAAPAVWFTIETNAVLVSWDPVDSAAAYRVYRNETGCDRGQFPVAEVDGATTSFLDDGLANGVPVFYRVQAIGANAACESPVSACVEAAPQPLAGNVRFDRQIYGCSHEIVLEVTDANHPSASIAVEIRSDTETTPEMVVLNETPEGSARFIGSIFTTSAPAAADGLLSIAGGDAITVEYVDQDDGEGGIGVVQQAVASSDCAPPSISGVRESGVTDARATITWSTDEEATSRLFIGETVPPSDERATWGLTTDHAVSLTGLGECTVYYYAVLSEDAAVNVAVDDNGGAYFHFETLVDTGTGPRPCHQGRIDVEVDSVACESSVPIRVEDPDLNTDPSVAETVVLTVTSSSEADPEPVVLTETGADTSVFTGSISTAGGAPSAGDGLLQVATGDLVTATYADADDGTGGPRNSFDTAEVDCDGPGHTSVWVSDITDGSAVIHWTTSEPSTGHVEWGPTSALGNVVSSDTLATAHDALVATVPGCARIYGRRRRLAVRIQRRHDPGDDPAGRLRVRHGVDPGRRVGEGCAVGSGNLTRRPRIGTRRDRRPGSRPERAGDLAGRFRAGDHRVRDQPADRHLRADQRGAETAPLAQQQRRRRHLYRGHQRERRLERRVEQSLRGRHHRPAVEARYLRCLRAGRGQPELPDSLPPVVLQRFRPPRRLEHRRARRPGQQPAAVRELRRLRGRPDLRRDRLGRRR